MLLSIDVMQRRRIHQNTNVSVNRVENCPVNFRPELSTVLATLLCGWSYHEIDFTVLRIFLFSLTFVYIVLQTVFFFEKNSILGLYPLRRHDCSRKA